MSGRGRGVMAHDSPAGTLDSPATLVSALLAMLELLGGLYRDSGGAQMTEIQLVRIQPLPATSVGLNRWS